MPERTDGTVRRYRGSDDWGTYCADPDCTGDAPLAVNLNGDGQRIFRETDHADPKHAALQWIVGHLDRHHPGWTRLHVTDGADLRGLTGEQARATMCDLTAQEARDAAGTGVVTPTRQNEVIVALRALLAAQLAWNDLVNAADRSRKNPAQEAKLRAEADQAHARYMEARREYEAIEGDAS